MAKKQHRFDRQRFKELLPSKWRSQSRGDDERDVAQSGVAQPHQLSQHGGGASAETHSEPEPSPCFGLWQEAFQALKDSQPQDAKIIEELGLIERAGDGLRLGDEVSKRIGDVIEKYKEDHKMAEKTKEILVSASELVVKGKDVISAGAALNPYLAAAWTGISLALPIYRFNELEMFHPRVIEGQSPPPLLASSETSTVRQLVKEMYTGILSYEVKLLVFRRDKNSLQKIAADYLDSNEWKSRIETLEKLDSQCTRLIEQVRQLRAQRRADEVRKREIVEDARRVMEDIYTEYDDVKDKKGERVEGTCQWFLRHPEFMTWRQKASALLWVSADPGCGKSVLAKYMVECAADLVEHVNSSASSSSSRPLVCYYFFDAATDTTSSASLALCALIYQILDQIPYLHKQVIRSLRGRPINALKEGLSMAWEIFLSLCQDDGLAERGIICILDGLDECQARSRDALMMELNAIFASRTDLSRMKLKIFLTSRPYLDIEEAFASSPESGSIRIRGEDQTLAIAKEIDLVIESNVKKLAGRKGMTEKAQTALKKKLKEKKHRTYLWLYLIMELFERKWTIGKMQDISPIIDSLPASLNLAYAEILSRSPDGPGHHETFKLLQIILAAREPLSEAEAFHAMYIGPDVYSPEDLQPGLLTRPGLILRHLSGFMIQQVDGKLYFLHDTVREFLLASRGAENERCHEDEQYSESEKLLLKPWFRRFPMEECEHLLGEACVQYIKLLDAPERTSLIEKTSSSRSNGLGDSDSDNDSDNNSDSDSDSDSGSASPLPLLDYALTCWYKHLNSSGQPLSNRVREIILNQFFVPSSQCYLALFEIRTRALDHEPLLAYYSDKQQGKDDMQRFGQNTLSLIYAMQFDLIKLATTLNIGQCHLKLEGTEMTPLWMAAHKGQVESVRYLLSLKHSQESCRQRSENEDKDKEPEEETTILTTPGGMLPRFDVLLEALRRADVEIVRLFVKHLEVDHLLRVQIDNIEYVKSLFVQFLQTTGPYLGHFGTRGESEQICEVARVFLVKVLTNGDIEKQREFLEFCINIATERVWKDLFRLVYELATSICGIPIADLGAPLLIYLTRATPRLTYSEDQGSDFATFLVKLGVDPCSEDPDGRNIFHKLSVLQYRWKEEGTPTSWKLAKFEKVAQQLWSVSGHDRNLMNRKDHKGVSPSAFAIKFGSFAAFQWLLDNGAEFPELSVTELQQAMCMAAFYGYDGWVAILEAKGASINAQLAESGPFETDREFRGLLEHSERKIQTLAGRQYPVEWIETIRYQYFCGTTPLWLAAYQGHEELALQLYERQDVSKDVSSPNGRNLLVAAAIGLCSKLLVRLLDDGWDAGHRTVTGATVLHSALYGRQTTDRLLFQGPITKDLEGIVAMLVQQPALDLAAVDKYGRTCLRTARLLRGRARTDEDNYGLFYDDLSFGFYEFDEYSITIGLILTAMYERKILIRVDRTDSLPDDLGPDMIYQDLYLDFVENDSPDVRRPVVSRQ